MNDPHEWTKIISGRMAELTVYVLREKAPSLEVKASIRKRPGGVIIEFATGWSGEVHRKLAELIEEGAI